MKLIRIIALCLPFLIPGCLPVDDDDGDDDVGDDDTGDDDGGDDDTGDDDTGPTPLLTQVATLPHPADGWIGPGGGLAYRDGALWVGFGAWLWEIDAETGAVITLHNKDDWSFAGDLFDGMAFDDTLWGVGSTADQVFHFHAHPPVGGDFAEWLSGSANTVALAHDGTWLWGGMWGLIVQYDMTEDMLWAEEYDTGNYGVHGLAWGAGGPALWSCGDDLDGTGSSVVARHATNGTMALEAVFPIDYGCTGLATDGSSIWASVFWPNGDAVKEIRKYTINW